MTAPERWHIRVSAVILSLEAILRGTSTLIYPPQSPLLNITTWMIGPLFVAGVLIFAALMSWRSRWARWLGGFGHLLGLALVLIYGLHTLFQGFLFDQPWQTLGLSIAVAWGHFLMLRMWVNYIPEAKP